MTELYLFFSSKKKKKKRGKTRGRSEPNGLRRRRRRFPSPPPPPLLSLPVSLAPHSRRLSHSAPLFTHATATPKTVRGGLCPRPRPPGHHRPHRQALCQLRQGRPPLRHRRPAAPHLRPGARAALRPRRRDADPDHRLHLRRRVDRLRRARVHPDRRQGGQADREGDHHRRAARAVAGRQGRRVARQGADGAS